MCMRDDSVPEVEADGPDWPTRELELLHHAVEDELSVYNTIGDFGITDEAIRTLAWAVTTRVEYAFRVTWSPNWVASGRPHVWTEAGEWHARCNDCLQESPSSASESDVNAWFDSHVAERHAL